MPLILLAWCAGLVIGNTQLVPALVPATVATGLTLGALGVAAAVARPGWAGAWILVPAVLLLGAGRGAATVHVPGPGTIDGHLGQHVTLVGRAMRAAGGAGLQSFWLAENRLGLRALSGTVQVSARSAVTVVPGSTLRVTGTLERLPGRAYDGSTGYDDRMERQGVLAAMPGATYTVIAPPPALSLSAMTWRVRAALTDGVRTRIPEPEASILLGELVGIRSKLPPAVEAQLVGSGLVHLLAVSGLKVALVASMLTALLRQAGRRAALLAIAGIFAYAVVGGGSAAAIRSALMGSLALVAQVLRRDSDPPRSLLLAATPMLTINPALASDLSFQYSFLGVAGIQLMQPAIVRRTRWVPRLLREALAVTLAAQVATLPLTAAYFHVISLAAPLTNTLAIPMLPPTMLAAAWVALGLPDPGGAVVAVAGGSAHLQLALAALGSGTAGMTLAVPWFGAAHAAAYLAGLGVVLATSLLGLPRAAALRLPQQALATPAGAMLVAGLVMLVMAGPDGRLHLVFLDTPGGGALVTAPDGARLLVDTGSSPSRLAASLDAQFAPGAPGLEALLLTASAAPAAGGLEGLGTRLPAEYFAPRDTSGEVPARLAATLSESGTRVQWVAGGDRLRWHGLDLEAAGCGAGLAITVRFGAVAAWVCDADIAGDAGEIPPGPLTAVGVGPGAARPDGAWPDAGWVVAQGSRSPAGVFNTAALGPRLWRPPRDGPLVLSCDARTCRRS